MLALLEIEVPDALYPEEEDDDDEFVRCKKCVELKRIYGCRKCCK
jgi:hypothetical protein